MKKIQTLLLSLVLLVPIAGAAQDLAVLANEFLAGLPEDVRQQAAFPLKDEERFNMNFVPMVRKGPTFHDFNDAQRKAALALLKGSLSAVGYDKSTAIMELEKVLIIVENNRLKLSNGKQGRDPLNYHFCIFGKPSASGDWAWRF